jgi:hypothetical protein
MSFINLSFTSLSVIWWITRRIHFVLLVQPWRTSWKQFGQKKKAHSIWKQPRKVDLHRRCSNDTTTLAKSSVQVIHLELTSRTHCSWGDLCMGGCFLSLKMGIWFTSRIVDVGLLGYNAVWTSRPIRREILKSHTFTNILFFFSFNSVSFFLSFCSKMCILMLENQWHYAARLNQIIDERK